jgi:hypothetical protein
MAINPYVFIPKVTKEATIEVTILYKIKLVEVQTYALDYTETIEGVEYTGIQAVRELLKYRSRNYGFYVNGKSYPKYVPEEEQEDPDEKAIKEQRKLFLETTGPKIPGLDKDAILVILASKEPALKKQFDDIQKGINEDIEAGMSEEDAKEKAKKDQMMIIEKYKESMDGYVDERIAEIEKQYDVFLKSVKTIPDTVATTIANIALPPALTVPPGAPNPVYSINLARQVKASLGIILASAVIAFGIIVKLSSELKFKLPEEVLKIFDTLKTFDGLLKSIPI